MTSNLCVIDMQCTSESVNLKNLLIAMNMKCCSTDLCNNDTTPVLLNQTANGQKCYTCVGQNCNAECQGRHCNKTSEIVECVGNEDRCIDITGGTIGVAIYMAGCASKRVCDSSAFKTTMLLDTQVKCCEGNLCNSAETFTLTFLFTLIPYALLSPFLLIFFLFC
ncbi:urokinase plasminogen activator surface receptor-like [Silurus meridionalis]|uniref:urokinase plasminogen activator surface receptor-like n=1 Tax=Silurus meridionalis TaxID=175797 RepID=UPI001EECC2FD|nr:urokinase plasminogen activator surface receptor-like [Silurus meridionalis]